jgi:hypothetical protein
MYLVVYLRDPADAVVAQKIFQMHEILKNIPIAFAQACVSTHPEWLVEAEGFALKRADAASRAARAAFPAFMAPRM